MHILSSKMQTKTLTKEFIPTYINSTIVFTLSIHSKLDIDAIISLFPKEITIKNMIKISKKNISNYILAILIPMGTKVDEIESSLPPYVEIKKMSIIAHYNNNGKNVDMKIM